MTQPQEKPQCDAKAKSTGKRCKRAPVPGLTKCKTHCGLSKEKREAKSKRNLALAEIAKLAESDNLVILPEANPMRRLLTTIAVESREERALSSLVDELTPNEMAGQWAPVVKRLDDVRHRIAHHCKMALDAGYEERRVRLAEEQGHQIVNLIIAVIDDRTIDMTMTQRRTIKKRLGEKFRELGSAEGA